MDPLVSMSSEVEDQRLRQSGMARYSLTSQLHLHHLLNDAERRKYGIRHAKQDVWIRWLLVLFELADDRSHSLW